MTTTNPNPTSTVTVTVRLSAAAQRAALLAGQPAQAEQTYPVETPEDLAALLALPGAAIQDDGSVYCRHLRSPSRGSYSIPPLDARPGTAAEAIAAIAAAQAALDALDAQYAAEQAAEKAAQEARMAEARAALATGTLEGLAAGMRAGLPDDELRPVAERVFAGQTPQPGYAGSTAAYVYLDGQGLPWLARGGGRLRVPAFDAAIKAAQEAEEATREAKRLADLASLDAALKRVLSAEDAAAVYAGEHADVPCGVLALDAAKTRVLDAILPLPERAKLRAPQDYAGDACSGKFLVQEDAELELTLDEARRALQVRADVTRALNAAPEGLVAECSAVLREHAFIAEDEDDLGGEAPPRNVGLRVRLVLAGGAVLVREVAVA